MKFCPECASHMTKTTSTTGILFYCRCQNQIPGTAEDTIMAEEYISAGESLNIHDVFIENAVHDPAGMKVRKLCPKCKLDFMTMVRIGEQEKTFYLCSCGA